MSTSPESRPAVPPVGGDASFGTDAFDSVDALAARGHRATLYLRVLAYVVIANVALWLPVAVMMRATALAIVDVGLLVTGLGALWLTRLGHVHVARALVALCIFVAVALVVAIAYGDTGSEIRLANLWFIVLAVAAYFVFYDYRPLVRDTYALLAFGLFVAYAAGVGPRLEPMRLPREYHDAIESMVAASIAISLFVMMRLFMFELSDAERRLGLANARLERILENMLPKAVADRLRTEGRAFADPCPDCSVLFADLVGFTELSERLPADEVVELLNRIFSRFDDLTEQAGLTKIKTIGDAYMVAAGVLEPRADHASAIAALALALQDAMDEFDGLSLRAGISSGPVIAGVIGKRRLVYDLWGDTVNVAARMASGGVAGRVQVTADSWRRLAGAFDAEPRGTVEVKGKGPMKTYLLASGLRPDSA